MAVTAWPWDVARASEAVRPGPLTVRTAFADGAAREEAAAAWAIPRIEVRVPGLASADRFRVWAEANPVFLWQGLRARIAGGPGAVRYRQIGRTAQLWTAELTVELLAEEPWLASAGGGPAAVDGGAAGALSASARAGGRWLPSGGAAN